MDQHGGDQGAHGTHPVAKPTPAGAWPLFAGLAALLLGCSLLWWAESDNDFAGPLLGASMVATLIAIVGWGIEDVRTRKRADQLGDGVLPTRFTQVVTFAVAEGQLATARGKDGVLGAIDHADSGLRALAGFQDLRITVSPAEAGPSQVLVETTWWSKDELATYEESRRSVLDLIAQHPDEVVPGSVQVFDMEVVRDTKDVALHFPMGAAATIVGSLVVGGFMVGAGIALFDDDEGTAAADGGENGGGFSGTIVAKNTLFEETEFTVPPGQDVTLTLDNQDAGIFHNIHIFKTASGGDSLDTCKSGCEEPPTVATKLEKGAVKQTFTFTTPNAGEYQYICDAHPTTMKGTMKVVEGAPLPGQSSGGGGGGTEAGGGTTVIATDNKFDKATLNAAAATDVTFTMQNDGKVPHNLSFYEARGGKTIKQGEIATAGKTVSVSFKTPQAGKYFFQCDLHPSEMIGDLIVQ